MVLQNKQQHYSTRPPTSKTKAGNSEVVLILKLYTCTVEPVLKDRLFGHKNMVSEDRWSLVAGPFILK